MTSLKYLFLSVFILLIGLAFYSTYLEVKKRTIEEFNAQQMILAKQASIGIKSLLDNIFTEINSLSQEDSIVLFDDYGKEMMEAYYRYNSHEIRGITRVDADGRIVYTIPFSKGAIGTGISDQEHVRQVMESHQPVLSDVFHTIQGYSAVAYHIPIFRNDLYLGSLAVLIPFEIIAKKYLEDIKIGRNGSAWMISKKGVELYCPVLGHTGKSIFQTSANFPSLISMVNEMLDGKSGTCTYRHEVVRNGRSDIITKHGAYYPVFLGNTFWSIAVATPEKEVLATMTGFRNRLFIIVTLLMFVGLIYLYMIIKAWAILGEEKKRKHAEEALRESEARLRQVIDLAPNFIFAKDKNGRFILANKAIADAYGTTVKDIIGKKSSELDQNLSEEFEEHLIRENLRIIESGEIKVIPEEKIIEKDGNLIFFQTIKIPFKLSKGDNKAMLCVSNDITKRKKVEDALKKSEKQYRDLVELANSIVLRWDNNGNIIYMNSYGLDFFGFRLEELQGKNVVGTIVPEIESDTERDLIFLMKDIQTDPEQYKNNENENVKKDGSRVWISWSNKAILGKNGDIIEILSIGNDITEKKDLETRLQRAQKMEAIGTLAGGIAHDLNNILSGIVSYPELLLLDLTEDSPLWNPIKTIQKSGQKAAVIVQDLLTLARRGVSVTELTNLNTLISEYLQSPEHKKLISNHKDVQVITDLDPDLLNIICSPVHLSKAIMNLVSNAVESMHDIGMILIRTENRYVDKPIRGYDNVKTGDYTVLSITDTGVGILPDDMPRIFEPFYTKKVLGRSGSGLGMAVVWGAVKDHNGYIDMDSSEGKGTTFTLYFPATREKIDPKESIYSFNEYMGNGEHILVVDDIEEQRDIASGILKRLGYSVATVSSGEEAVEYLMKNDASLLLLDMIMGSGMDGLDTYRKIIDLYPKQKAIIASGFTETDRVKEVQRLGASRYIKKPYTIEKISIAVCEELKK